MVQKIAKTRPLLRFQESGVAREVSRLPIQREREWLTLLTGGSGRRIAAD